MLSTLSCDETYIIKLYYEIVDSLKTDLFTIVFIYFADLTGL